MNIDRRIVGGSPVAQGDVAEINPPDAPAQLRQSGQGWVARHKRILFVAGGVLAALLLALFIVPRLGGNAEKGMITATATKGDIEATVTALGNLQPKDYVDVGAQVSGQIKAIHVDIGDVVKQGDPLIEIDAQVQQARVDADKDNLASARAQLVNAQAQLELKKTQYEREVRLDKAGATSKDELQSAKAAYAAAQAQIAQTKAQIEQQESTLKADEATLGYSNITAPRDGTVVSLDARVGQTINSVQQAPVLLRIADLSAMTVWTQVSEADVAKLKAGMDAYFTTLGNPDRRYPGKLRQILPTPETVNNVILYTALFDVPNPDGSLMTQMTAQVYFVTASAKNILIIPAAALNQAGQFSGKNRMSRAGSATPSGAVPGMQANRGTPGTSGNSSRGGNAQGGAERGQWQGADHGDWQNHAMVLVIGANGKPEPRRIETGVSDRVNVEVKSGLKEGEKVVVGQQQPEGTSSQRPQQGAGRSPLTPGPFPGGGRGRF